jgi:pilus assembly protein CpaC
MRIRIADALLLGALALCANALRGAAPEPAQQLQVTSGKTRLLDTEVNIERVSVAAPEFAEAVPVSPRTLMLNGRAPGETSLVVWLVDGTRREYDLSVRAGEGRLEAARQQAEVEFNGKVKYTVDGGSVYVTGTVKDLFASQRAVSIGETLGKVVNLLKIEVPQQESQILLKVRFANVDRSKSTDLGINFVGAPRGFPFSATTGGYSPGRVSSLTPPALTLSDSLNLLFWDPQINVGATLKDLAAKAVLQILAEPNLLAMNGHEASFVAGGEFPFPTLQGGGAGVGQVTISFRQFGVQIKFLPVITPRGTIRLHLAPEVSSLDYANALSVSGYTIPALNTRRVDTEIELKSGQTFAIAGLLDQRTTESLARIPGLADIPVLGKLFTSKSISAQNSELLVLVTPELVSPADAKDVPDLERPLKFMQGPGIMNTPPQTPGADKTGPVPEKPKRDEIPVQELEKYERDQQDRTGGAASGLPLVQGSGGSGGGGAGIPLAPIQAGAVLGSAGAATGAAGQSGVVPGGK